MRVCSSSPLGLGSIHIDSIHIHITCIWCSDCQLRYFDRWLYLMHWSSWSSTMYSNNGSLVFDTAIFSNTTDFMLSVHGCRLSMVCWLRLLVGHFRVLTTQRLICLDVPPIQKSSSLTRKCWNNSNTAKCMMGDHVSHQVHFKSCIFESWVMIYDSLTIIYLPS